MLDGIQLKTIPSNNLIIPCAEVREFSQNTLLNIASTLNQIMIDNNGIGIAAPQGNINIAMFLINRQAPLQGFLSKASIHDFTIIINPKIRSYSQSTPSREGCLSVPNMEGSVERFKSIDIEYQNIDGEQVIETVKGQIATIIQHETDHLHGILYPARMKEKAARVLMRHYEILFNSGDLSKYFDIMKDNLQLKRYLSIDEMGQFCKTHGFEIPNVL